MSTRRKSTRQCSYFIVCVRVCATDLQFEFLNSLFDLDRVFCLSDWSFPHAVRQQGEESVHNLKETKEVGPLTDISTVR